MPRVKESHMFCWPFSHRDVLPTQTCSLYDSVTCYPCQETTFGFYHPWHLSPVLRYKKVTCVREISRGANAQSHFFFFFAFPIHPLLNTEELGTMRREGDGWWRLVLDAYAILNLEKAESWGRVWVLAQS